MVLHKSASRLLSKVLSTVALSERLAVVSMTVPESGPR